MLTHEPEIFARLARRLVLALLPLLSVVFLCFFRIVLVLVRLLKVRETESDYTSFAFK